MKMRVVLPALHSVIATIVLAFDYRYRFPRGYVPWRTPEAELLNGINAPAFLAKGVINLVIADPISTRLPFSFNVSFIGDTVVYVVFIWLLWFLMAIRGGQGKIFAGRSKLPKWKRAACAVFVIPLAMLCVDNALGFATYKQGFSIWGLLCAIPYGTWVILLSSMAFDSPRDPGRVVRAKAS